MIFYAFSFVPKWLCVRLVAPLDSCKILWPRITRNNSSLPLACFQLTLVFFLTSFTFKFSFNKEKEARDLFHLLPITVKQQRKATTASCHRVIILAMSSSEVSSTSSTKKKRRLFSFSLLRRFVHFEKRNLSVEIEVEENFQGSQARHSCQHFLKRFQKATCSSKALVFKWRFIVWKNGFAITNQALVFYSKRLFSLSKSFKIDQE